MCNERCRTRSRPSPIACSPCKRTLSYRDGNKISPAPRQYSHCVLKAPMNYTRPLPLRWLSYLDTQAPRSCVRYVSREKELFSVATRCRAVNNNATVEFMILPHQFSDHVSRAAEVHACMHAYCIRVWVRVCITDLSVAETIASRRYSTVL